MRKVSGLTAIMVAAILPLALNGCASSNTPVVDQQTANLLQSSLDSSVSAIRVPGATMTVIRPDGAKWVGVSGLSNIENNTAMAPGLKFRIASVTKTFTATVILQLVKERRISLDDTLDSVLPGLVPNGAQISIRQLLNHTSGIFDYAQAQNPSFFQGEYNNPLRKWMPAELIAIANSNTPYFAPGNGFHYSNTNYVLLGMIIEKLTGNTYAQEVTSRIFAPLGLNNTSIPATADRPPGSSQGYTYNGSTWVNTTRMDPSWAFATGSIISNSDDLVTWLYALMNGTLIDYALKTEMFTFVDTQGVVTEGPNGYGLGLEKINNSIGHTGDFVFGGQAAIYQKQGWAFVVLVNASPSTPGVGFGSEYITGQAMVALGLSQ